MENKANDTFAFDLENRLDDFFSDSLPGGEDAPADEHEPSKADFPLKDLKSAILAIDWEITDAGMDSFIHQVNELMGHFPDDIINLKLLKILGSLGKYLRTHKSKAHQDTIKRIMAVYSTLEGCVTNDELSQSDRKKLLREEIKQFQRLKSQIVKSPSSRQPQQSAPAPTTDAVLEAIEELKSMITTELAAIRDALKQLNK